MWGTIAPKMEIHIKRSSNESTQIIDGKANSLARDSEPEMIDSDRKPENILQVHPDRIEELKQPIPH
jgi:hypothetical protein